MKKTDAILITGAAGFIASCMIQYLNEKGFRNLILVDNFFHKRKDKNWKHKKYKYAIEREELLDWLDENNPQIKFVIHLGARTDTTEFNYSFLKELNFEYSQDIWNYCTVKNIPLIYASSAATYGTGEFGYKDDDTGLDKLEPLNPYGKSKNEFDKWAVNQINHPPFWAGLKFFNVYGPNEYHKGRMASVIFHSFNQVKKEGVVKLFKSHREGFKDGEQLRDFIYVKDVVKVIEWMMKEVGSWQLTVDSKNHQLSSGIYNLGTGKARSFIDLVNATYGSMNLRPNIVFIDMPEDIREKYQYYTEAVMQKLRDAGYKDEFCSLEEGVNDYVGHYLAKGEYY